LPQLRLTNDFYGVAYSHAVPNLAKPGRTGIATLSVSITEDNSGDTLLCNHIRATIEQPGAVNQAWMHNVTAFMAKLQKEQVRILHHGFLANLPYMLIGALPLCAVLEVAVS
jgi:hypothetical protein